MPNYSRRELDDQIEGLQASFEDYQRRNIRCRVPQDAIAHAVRLRSIGDEYHRKADKLIDDTKADVSEREEIQENLVRLSASIFLLQKASKKGLLTHKQVKSILKGARTLARKARD